jgi:hypothetical protein
MDQAAGTVKRWHVDAWPPLAWLETVIKLIALGIGLVTLIGALSDGDFDLPGGVRLGQLIVLAVLSLGLGVAIADRIIEREIVAMAFVIVNNLGHWGMVIALASADGPGTALVAFCALMLIGDLVKVVFLRVHHYTTRDTPPAVMVGLTLFYAAGYGLILLLEAVR